MLQTKEQQLITDRYNELVKERYQSPNITDWIMANGNMDEEYIEISSSETLSGHAEILEFNAEDYGYGEEGDE